MSKNYKIAVLPGDGTGPEVIAEAIKVLDAAGKKFGFSTEKKYFDWGGEHYLKTGETLPADAKEQLSKHDAVLLGAIGHPDVKPGVLEKGILLKLRFDLDQYINLRPVKLYPGVETPLANKKPEDIDYINAHGTATHHNDLFETKAIKLALGDHAYKVKINSTKSMIGHLLGAAGGVEFIDCVKSIQDGFVHATAGLKVDDPECDLDYTKGDGVSMEVKTVLTNSLGFGGHNACLLVRKFEE